jgi:hypothetical protein
VNSRKTPEWFRDDIEALGKAALFKEPQALGPFLSDARSEMVKTYTVYNAQVKYTVSILFGLITFAGVIIAFSLRQGTNEVIPLYLGAKLVPAVLLLSVVPISLLSVLVTAQAYRMYVSAVVFATETHVAAGVERHPWFDWVFTYLEREPPPPSRTKLVDTWMWDPTSVFLPYAALMLIIAGLCIAASVVLFVRSP